MSSPCPICDATLDIDEREVIPGELLECPQCGSELEVEAVDPLVVAAAPCEEEDWGE